MKLNEIKFYKEISEHKKGIAEIDHKLMNCKDLSQANIQEVVKEANRSKELALVLAEFKCQICKKEEDLTYHHVYDRSYQHFLTVRRYITSRNYWSNIIVLCRGCHNLIEGDIFNTREGKTISDKKISLVKKRFLKVDYLDKWEGKLI